MKLSHLIPCLAAGSLLAACAANGNGDTARSAAATFDATMAEADVAAKSGQGDKALTLWRGAATAFPAEKSPWLQMAQMKFDCGSYAGAISDALEALQRDPVDKVANSIVAASGLRLSSRAIADLTRQNDLSGSLRSEAQELAKLLRASLGEEVLVPPAGKKPAPVRSAGKAAPASKAPQHSGGADPFGALK